MELPNNDKKAQRGNIPTIEDSVEEEEDSSSDYENQYEEFPETKEFVFLEMPNLKVSIGSSSLKADELIKEIKPFLKFLTKLNSGRGNGRSYCG